jgi:hypothetical protein
VPALPGRGTLLFACSKKVWTHAVTG